MNFKNSLDKYLTTPPDDGFDGWTEDVLERISDRLFWKNENWFTDTKGQCNKWLNELYYDREKNVSNSVEIIERAFNIFIKKKQSYKNAKTNLQRTLYN